jgi:RNA polymerase sigma-70 factor (ECF subfamily)
MKAEDTAAVDLRPTENGTRSYEAISDEAVISRVCAGERDLFEIIMRRYNQRLYRVARSIVRNEAEAEDVVQDAYVRAYTHLGQYAGEAKFSTWLTRIAVNEGLRRLRKRGRFDDMQRMASTAPLTAEAPDRYASDREVRQIIESAIEGLPSAYRSVVMLRDVEDLSTAEAANCLGIPPATVKTRLHRGHALLRETLGSTLGANRPELFAFGFSRCDRLVRLVLHRIGAGGGVGADGRAHSARGDTRVTGLRHSWASLASIRDNGDGNR